VIYKPLNVQSDWTDCNSHGTSLGCMCQVCTDTMTTRILDVQMSAKLDYMKTLMNYNSPKFSSLDDNLESLAVQDTHFSQCLISHTDEGTIVYSTYICPSLDKINM